MSTRFGNNWLTQRIGVREGIVIVLFGLALLCIFAATEFGSFSLFRKAVPEHGDDSTAEGAILKLLNDHRLFWDAEGTKLTSCSRIETVKTKAGERELWMFSGDDPRQETKMVFRGEASYFRDVDLWYLDEVAEVYRRETDLFEHRNVRDFIYLSEEHWGPFIWQAAFDTILTSTNGNWSVSPTWRAIRGLQDENVEEAYQHEAKWLEAHRRLK
jgi:hypothetical protein